MVVKTDFCFKEFSFQKNQFKIILCLSHFNLTLFKGESTRGWNVYYFQYSCISCLEVRGQPEDVLRGQERGY